MTDFEDKQVANNETMEDAMNSVQEVSVGDIVKGEVLAIEDKQVVVGIEGAGVEGVVLQRNYRLYQLKMYTNL